MTLWKRWKKMTTGTTRHVSSSRFPGAHEINLRVRMMEHDHWINELLR